MTEIGLIFAARKNKESAQLINLVFYTTRLVKVFINIILENFSQLVAIVKLT